MVVVLFVWLVFVWLSMSELIVEMLCVCNVGVMICVLVWDDFVFGFVLNSKVCCVVLISIVVFCFMLSMVIWKLLGGGVLGVGVMSGSYVSGVV